MKLPQSKLGYCIDGVVVFKPPHSNYFRHRENVSTWLRNRRKRPDWMQQLLQRFPWLAASHWWSRRQSNDKTHHRYSKSLLLEAVEAGESLQVIQTIYHVFPRALNEEVIVKACKLQTCQAVLNFLVEHHKEAFSYSLQPDLPIMRALNTLQQQELTSEDDRSEAEQTVLRLVRDCPKSTPLYSAQYSLLLRTIQVGASPRVVKMVYAANPRALLESWRSSSSSGDAIEPWLVALKRYPRKEIIPCLLKQNHAKLQRLMLVASGTLLSRNPLDTLEMMMLLLQMRARIYVSRDSLLRVSATRRNTNEPFLAVEVSCQSGDEVDEVLRRCCCGPSHGVEALVFSSSSVLHEQPLCLRSGWDRGFRELRIQGIQLERQVGESLLQYIQTPSCSLESLCLYATGLEHGVAKSVAHNQSIEILELRLSSHNGYCSLVTLLEESLETNTSILNVILGELMRSGVTSLGILFMCALNRSGRSFMRRDEATTDELIEVLGTRYNSLSTIYGLLRDNPMLWAEKFR